MMNSARYVRGMPNQGWLPDRPDVLEILATAEAVDAAVLAAGSNYVYLLTLRHPDAGDGYAIYKPRRGEAPLSDFPDGTLYKREVAAYLISEALGWDLIPPTIVREEGLGGGVGALQLFIEHDPSQHYFTIKDERPNEMRRVAAFDWLTNNADRKGGHCLIDKNGRLWCIDQGLTFHTEDKLRTVIWDFQGETVPDELAQDVLRFCQRLETDLSLREQLLQLIAPSELARLSQRAQVIASGGVFPPPPPWRPYPWPMI